MRLIIISLGSLFSLLAAALVAFIWGMVQLVGAGDNFWSVGIVWFTLLCIIAALACWVGLAVYIRNERRTTSRNQT